MRDEHALQHKTCSTHSKASKTQTNNRENVSHKSLMRGEVAKWPKKEKEKKEGLQ